MSPHSPLPQHHNRHHQHRQDHPHCDDGQRPAPPDTLDLRRDPEETGLSPRGVPSSGYGGSSVLSSPPDARDSVSTSVSPRREEEDGEVVGGDPVGVGVAAPPHAQARWNAASMGHADQGMNG